MLSVLENYENTDFWSVLAWIQVKNAAKVGFFEKSPNFDREYLKSGPVKRFYSLIKITNKLETNPKTVRACPIWVAVKDFFPKRRCTIAKTSQNASKINFFRKICIFDREYLKNRSVKYFISLIKIANKLETNTKTTSNCPIRVYVNDFFSKRICTKSKPAKITDTRSEDLKIWKFNILKSQISSFPFWKNVCFGSLGTV